MNKKTLLLYSYSGFINPEIKSALIPDFRKVVKANIPTVDKQKKSAYIFQEAVNNVLNYYTDMHLTDAHITDISCSSFLDTTAIALSFTNHILHDDAAVLEKKLNELNNTLPERLKEALASNLNKPISSERGANIGLITILLKSNNMLKYEFTKVDAFMSIFTLTVLLQ